MDVNQFIVSCFKRGSSNLAHMCNLQYNSVGTYMYRVYHGWQFDTIDCLLFKRNDNETVTLKKCPNLRQNLLQINQLEIGH